MKTSNKILAAYSAIIFLAMISIFVIAKNREHFKKQEINLVLSTFKLSDFNVVVVNENVNCKILKSDTSCIKWSLEEGYEINEGFASVFNDTLFISNTRTKFYIYCKDLRSVITRDSCNVNIEFPVKDSLLINGHGGGIKVSSVSEFLKINAENTFIYINAPYNKIYAELSGGRIDVQTVNGKEADLTLKNYAVAEFKRPPEKFNASTDSTSIYLVNKY